MKDARVQEARRSERPRTLDVELTRIKSGALAVRDRVTGEVMHSAIGPTVESKLLYVEASRLEARLRARVAARSREPLVLLDVGLGAGSNAALALAVSERAPESARRLEIWSFDRSTAALSLALASADAAELGFSGEAMDLAGRLLDGGVVETARTTWRLVVGELPDTLVGIPPASADIVFWDPFSPRVNPELWGLDAFTKLRRACRDGATIHTYSQATKVRAALLLADPARDPAQQARSWPARPHSRAARSGERFRVGCAQNAAATK